MDDSQDHDIKAKATGKDEAEVRLAALLSSGQPMTKEKATEALLAFAAAGRVRKPSSGRGG